ncbi:MAG: ATP-binding protein [Candidatus Puniceispirillaceae bacterium]
MRLRTYLPKTLFGRMLAIILVPMILVQVITVFVFYERHWNTVTRYMASSLASEISLLVDEIGATPDEASLEDGLYKAAHYFNFNLTYEPQAILTIPPKLHSPSFAEDIFTKSLDARLTYPWAVDLISHEDLIFVDVQLGDGVLHVAAGRKRLFSSTSWTFLGWTISTSILLFLIALIFLRGQVRPIHRLTNAARQLGLGREVENFNLEGAKEIRLAGRAFQAMRHRIDRQMKERTSMLAGVSHDLRTPLTRMRLNTALASPSSDIEAIDQDIEEMEQMIEGYLSFARGEGTEKASEVRFDKIVRQIVERHSNAQPGRLRLIAPAGTFPIIEMRVQAMRRAIDNLVGNALRYANSAEIRLKIIEDEVVLFIDDDGPGIAPDQYHEAIKPFIRLESSRNKQTGGTGLGLSIASDVILSHGGELSLHDSPLGGLRVMVKLPI